MIKLIDEKNNKLKTELTTQYETTTGTTNTALANLTALITSMQISQTESSKNMNTLMTRLGLSNENQPTEIYQDSREDTIELSFETETNSITQTPEKMQPTHRYNTRSVAKMEVDNYHDKETTTEGIQGNIHGAGAAMKPAQK
jgi:hypothetical protein